MSQVEKFCTGNRISTMVFHYIFSILSILAAISIIPGVCAYIKAQIKGNLQVTKPLFYAGIVFFIVSVTAIITFFGAVISYCDHNKLHKVFAMIGPLLYALQTILLIGILFYRLLAIFQDTVFALRKWISTLFLLLYTITAVIFVFASVMWSISYAISSWSSFVTGILVIFLIVYLNALFIYKLIKANNNCEQKDQQLIMVITKTALLSFISTFVTLSCAIFFSLGPSIDSIYWGFIRDLLILADEYTNFACVFLSYAYFKRYYEKICSKCDATCRILWSKCMLNHGFKAVHNAVDSGPQHDI
eukprot:150956_1